MSEEIIKQALLKLFPKGSAWRPKIDGQFDKLVEGIAANEEFERAFLAGIARIRDPQTTPYLDDLEYEYGLIKDNRLTEAERRDQLQAIVYAIAGSGSETYLQDILHTAGFTQCFVYQNNPPVNPNSFLSSSALMVANGGNHYAGYYPVSLPTTAVAGWTNGIGELIVNGDLFQQYVAIEMVAGAGIAYAGYHTAGPPPYLSVCGYFSDTQRQPVEYIVPQTKETWPFVFFISHAGFELIDDPGMEDTGLGNWYATIGTLSKELTGIGTRQNRVLRVGYLNPFVTANARYDCGEIGKTYLISGEVRVNNAACTAALRMKGLGTVNISNSLTWTPFEFLHGPTTYADNYLELLHTNSAAGRWSEWNNVQVRSIEPVNVPAQRRQIFKTLVLKYKPLHSWCLALVNYS